MTYNEMKQKVYALQMEDLAPGIKVNELDDPRRFEAAGLGIIDMSQLDYYGPVGLYAIYSGEWNSPGRKIIKEIVPWSDAEVFGEYFSMLKDIEATILSKNFSDKQEV